MQPARHPASLIAIAATLVATAPDVTRTSLLLAGLLAIYAIAGTHDYLAWNRARDAGLHELLDSGISVREIDGGMV